MNDLRDIKQSEFEQGMKVDVSGVCRT